MVHWLVGLRPVADSPVFRRFEWYAAGTADAEVEQCFGDFAGYEPECGCDDVGVDVDVDALGVRISMMSLPLGMDVAALAAHANGASGGVDDVEEVVIDLHEAADSEHSGDGTSALHIAQEEGSRSAHVRRRHFCTPQK